MCYHSRDCSSNDQGYHCHQVEGHIPEIQLKDDRVSVPYLYPDQDGSHHKNCHQVKPVVTMLYGLGLFFSINKEIIDHPKENPGELLPEILQVYPCSHGNNGIPV